MPVLFHGQSACNDIAVLQGEEHVTMVLLYKTFECRRGSNMGAADREARVFIPADANTVTHRCAPPDPPHRATDGSAHPTVFV